MTVDRLDNSSIVRMALFPSTTTVNTKALAVQSIIDSAIVQLATGKETKYKITVQEMPRKCERWNRKFSIPFFMATMVTLGSLGVGIPLASEVAYERENGMHELLMIAGVAKSTLYVSWVLYGFVCMLLVSSVEVALLALEGNHWYSMAAGPILAGFFLSSLSHCLMFIFLGTLVSRSTRTTCLVVVLALATLFASPFILNVGIFPVYPLTLDELYAWITRAVSLFSPQIGLLNLISRCEAWKDAGVKPGFATTPYSDDYFSGIAEALMWIVVNGIVLLVLTWYVDNVRHSQFGISKPMCFCFHKEHCACGCNKQALSAESGESGVITEGLTKKYGKFKAVDNLSVTFRANEITAFLGRNGAGKTTALSMLTGMTEPTAGTAQVAGHDIRSGMSRVRQSLGYCPQHDALFRDLTVDEHMKLYGKLKGLAQSEIDSYSMSIFAKLQMPATAMKRPAKFLSGGMRRKLSIAAAFMGAPSVIILDEPTSGIDPFSRRAIWDLILSHRSKHTIVISTHYMQEADLLADRVAIIESGKLLCCDVPMNLKREFGDGSRITISHLESANPSEIQKAVSRHLPIEPVKSSTMETKYQVVGDGAQSAAMVEALKELEDRTTELGIQAIGVTEPTMEQVFFNANKQTQSKAAPEPTIQGADEKIAREQSPHRTTGQQSASELPEQVGTKQKDQPASTFLKIRACFLKRFHITKRRPSTWVLQVVLPLAFGLLATILMKVESTKVLLQQSEEKIAINPWAGGDHMTLFYRRSRNMTERKLLSFDVLQSFKQDGLGFGCLTYSGLTCNNEVEQAAAVHGNSTETTFDRSECRCEQKCPSAVEGKPHSINLRTQDNLLNLTRMSENTFLQYLQLSDDVIIGGVNEMVTASGEAQLQIYVPPIYRYGRQHLKRFAKERERQRFAAFILNNFVSTAIFRQVMANGKPNEVSIMTQFLAKNAKISFNPLSLFIVFVNAAEYMLITLMIVVSTLPTMFLLVNERVTRNKQFLLLAGLPKWLYWLSTLLWDLAAYSVTAIIILCTVLIRNAVLKDSKSMLEAIEIGPLLIVTLLTGGLMLLHRYALSFLLNNPRIVVTCEVVQFLLVAVLRLLINAFVVQSTDMQNLARIVVAVVMPSFAAQDACSKIILTSIPGYGTPKQKSDILGFSNVGAGPPLLGAFLGILASVVVIILLERNCTNEVPCACGRCCAAKKPPAVTAQPAELPPEVTTEADRAYDSNMAARPLTVKGLTRKFGDFLAVDNISFTVQPSECFGLLGVNGAGKSTTFKMLVREHKPTRGKAFVQGVDTNKSSVAQMISYCPQDDILFDEMTPLEHLNIYAMLRGITDRNSAAKKAINDLDLQEYANKQCGKLSGGTKRRVCLAIALVAGASVMYLDEATTGLDPLARHQAWATVTKQMKELGSAVVMTSHSMEECEQMCDRITIMVNGRFMCIGSVQFLKEKFGNMYTVKFRLTGNGSNINDHIKPHLSKHGFEGEITLVETHPGYSEIQMTAKNLVLSSLFEAVHAIKDTLGIYEFSVSQTTLEQIFVRMVRDQI